MRPLLSICIPTYNRADVLDETLASIVSNPSFTEEVEVVVSDNASTDHTPAVCRKYADAYPNVIYHRNEENIRDANFVEVLRLANGEYLKLFNDWATMRPEAVGYMLQAIKDNLDTRTPIFFTGHFIFTKWKKAEDPIVCRNLDEYIQVVSTYVTAIYIFGLWREQLEKIKDPLKYTKLMLNQVDWTYQLLENSGCVIYNHPIIGENKAMGVMVRKGYHWFQVHLMNYYTIMEPYRAKGLISDKTYIRDKRNLIYHFKWELRNIYFISDPYWKFDTEGTWKMLMTHYKTDWYFWMTMAKLPFKALRIKASRLNKSVRRSLKKLKGL